jgi:Transposase
VPGDDERRPLGADELVACGWQVEVADARRVKTVAPLAAKTDKVDARLLAELSRRQLVPALWLPWLDERALRERRRRRMHLLRLRTSAKGRIFGLQTQWGVRISLARLRRADGLTLLERAGVPDVWRRSVNECQPVSAAEAGLGEQVRVVDAQPAGCVKSALARSLYLQRGSIPTPASPWKPLNRCRGVRPVADRSMVRRCSSSHLGPL